MKLSGAGEYIERALRDMEELEVREDGCVKCIEIESEYMPEITMYTCNLRTSRCTSNCRKNSQYRLVCLDVGGRKVN